MYRGTFINETGQPHATTVITFFDLGTASFQNASVLFVQMSHPLSSLSMSFLSLSAFLPPVVENLHPTFCLHTHTLAYLPMAVH